MRRIPIEVGQRFGRLVVVRELETVRTFDGKRSQSYRPFLLLCDCGNQATVMLNSLRIGNTTSCGCYHSERTIATKTTHGKCGTPTHKVWMGMTRRCRDKSDPRYGGRGISVCERWLKYENFLADMGERPPGKWEIDRINNDGNYEPGNVRWANRKTQANTKSSNRILSYGGRSMNLAAWAAELGINHASLIERLSRWPIERALSQRKATA